jgi:tetratricopeptide (TPR) repeat protein
LTPTPIRHILAFMRLLLPATRFCASLLILALLLDSPARTATRDPWIEVRSQHFTVVSDAGEKQARRIADQFEQIRKVFQNAFPKLRADMGKPVTIFALKNEDSMKTLLPAYWEVKGHTHPAGLYIPGEDKHCVVVRTNIQGDNAYEVVYHEYTHALENLNFQELPLWLSEGIAEFLGNSKIHEGFVEIGVPAPHHFEVLREHKLIPIDVLLQVDSHSPYYNEENRASLFYAESWALVHYLLMDPEARQNQLLQNFLAAYQASGNQVEAAQRSFGDLRKFAQVMERYSRQDQSYVGRVTTSVHGDPKSYRSRTLTAAEVDALRGDLYTRTRRRKEAKEALDAALQEDPKLPLVHEGLGLLALSQQQTEEAEAEFTAAVQLNSRSFLAYYFSARARMRYGMNTEEETKQVTAALEKAISLNPQFAPAYEALSSLYSLHPETTDKAITAGKKAIELEPGTLTYAVSYGYVLLRLGKVADAKTMATRIQAVAKTPEDQSAARQLIEVVASREAYDAQVAAYEHQAEEAATQQASAAANPSKSGSNGPPPETQPANNHAGENEYAVEGIVFSAECANRAPAKITLTVNSKRTMVFRFPSLKDLQVLVRNDDVSDHPPPCTEWEGRHVRLFFYKLKDREFSGELSTIQFF